ncbi:MAG: hypothetical protein ACON35_04005 [Candidatus Marinamargulisbacteria bacterium]
MKKLLMLLLCLHVAAQAVTVYDRDVNQTRVGGYLDTEWVSEGNVNTFKAHRFIIQYGSILSPKTRFNSEIEYEYGGYVTNTDEAENSQKGEIKIEQAWVDHDLSDLFTLRAGIVLVPVGQLNIYHDSDMRDFTARPLVSSTIIPSTWMDTGVGGYGSIDVNDMEVTYEGYVINGLDHQNTYSTSKGLKPMRPNFKNDTNQGKAVAARLGLLPTINSKWGISTYQGQSKQSLIAFDGEVKFGPAKIKTEVANYSDAYNNKAMGYNLEGRYNIAPALGLNTPLNLLARIESVDLNTDNDSVGKHDRTSIGFNIKPEPSLVYKLEYSFNKKDGVNDADDTLMASVAVGF